MIRQNGREFLLSVEYGLRGVISIFLSAKSKLEDSRSLLEQLEASTDSIAFKSCFNSFLNSSRAITYAMQKEGSTVSGFSGWYAVKQEEMKNDELLRFIHEARTEDFHEGKHRLSFGTYVHSMTVNSAESPYPNAAISVGSDGPMYILDEGTPNERRIPFRNANYQITVAINNPPRMHQGIMIFNPNPINICRMTLSYFASLVSEATDKFN